MFTSCSRLVMDAISHKCEQYLPLTQMASTELECNACEPNLL